MRSGLFFSALSFLLKPISWLVEVVYVLRRICFNFGVFNQAKFQVPIVSVGNISFGGTGKTPFTMWLAEYLMTQEKKVMILSRGYKGKLEGKSGIIGGKGRPGINPELFGDEALLMAKRLKKVPIVVGKNRTANLDYYYEMEKPEVVLLDDGHQHLKLGRDLNIVLFDALMPLSHYQVAPSGYLREGFYGLKDADIIVIGRSNHVAKEKINSLKRMITPFLSENIIFAEMYYRVSGVFDARYGQVYTEQELRGKRFYCVAGIASPQYFFQNVGLLGCEIVKEQLFPDHHNYTLEEINAILEEAEQMQAKILTTEKDMVKIRKLINDERFYFLRIDVDFLEGEEDVLEKVREIF